MSLKEEFIIYVSPKKEVGNVIQGPLGKTWGGQEEKQDEGGIQAMAFSEVSAGEAKQGRGNSLQLASLNNSGGLWGCRGGLPGS